MTLLRSRRPKNQLQQTQFNQGQSKTLPAPTGGLNLRDDISNLKPNEARILENWLPTTGLVEFRPGKTFHAGGMSTGEVKTLAAYVGYSASKMLAGAGGAIWDVTSATQADGNDTYTKILLQFAGADASTTITDTSVGGSSHTWTASGNAQIDTADSKFGGSSCLFDGTGDYVSTTDHADFALGSGDFTIDFWFKTTAASGAFLNLCGQCDNARSAASTSFYIERDDNGAISATVCVGATTYSCLTSTQFTDILATGWHHLALVRYAGNLRVYIDGVQDGTTNTVTGTINDSSNAFAVGRAGEYATEPWNGWIDEFRLSVGIARWTTNFSVPTATYAVSSLKSGFSNDRWQTALYSDRLFFVNGTDTPQVYNGSTVADIAWSGSGLTNTNLVNIALVRNRLWFCESSQAWVWYANVGQITAASALTKFDLHQIAGGGYCMAVASWSRDGGDGADDLTVFVMSTGEIIIYQGDPATSFNLVGKFYGARPIGRQCTFKVGGELVIITTQGLLPISTATGGTVTAQDIAAINPWGKIAPGLAGDATRDSSNAGWHGVFHLGLVYVNVPQTTGTISKQRVLNTRNGSWTTYTGLNGSQFCSFNDELYFGTMDGGVMVHDGASDDGTDITAICSGAFVYPTRAQDNNLFTAARPKIHADGTVSGFVGVDVDFNSRLQTGATVDFSTGDAGGAWDVSAWDDTAWATDADSIQRWYSINGLGKAVSVRMTVTASSNDLQWFATDLLYKPGGIR